MAEVELNDDGSILTVLIPIAFQQQGGRKQIVSPPGEDTWQQQKTLPDNTMIKALARAHRWNKLLESGAYATVDDLAKAEKINASYVSRVLRLTLLAPAIVELNSRRTATQRFATRDHPEALSNQLARTIRPLWPMISRPLAKILMPQTDCFVIEGCFPFLRNRSVNLPINDHPVTRAAINPVMSGLSRRADKLQVAVNFSNGPRSDITPILLSMA